MTGLHRVVGQLQSRGEQRLNDVAQIPERRRKVPDPIREFASSDNTNLESEAAMG
ncbi:hypothetical protein NKI32_26450 [Mesorhizobium sp. M0761]|uniref:hypothetical protein n=1 Tax=Mesorhizobium sp. M0761 TaxID=2956994 RepID=UPI003334B6AD